MSITVADILNLPSLKGAKVLGGRKGLTKTVSSVTVLEFADPSPLQEEILQTMDFVGGEIVITAFANIPNNVEQQCSNIRRLSAAGEVGMILYYVGIFVPAVDAKLIKLADELNFTLIVMPENRMDLQYSEVIGEVMEAIIYDKNNLVSMISYDQIQMSELIRAILRDEPLKMRRLADLFRINVETLHDMWLLKCEGDAEAYRKEALTQMQQHLEQHCNTIVADYYDGDVVAIMDWKKKSTDVEAIGNVILDELKDMGIDAVLVRCYHLDSTADARRFFLCFRKHLDDVKRIFPRKKNFTISELNYAKSCRNQIEAGEEALSEIRKPLTLLEREKEGFELKRTLGIYLLDAQSSVARCAELMYLHKNTIKYRVKRICELLGYHVDKEPEKAELYSASAIDRLL